MEKFSTEEQASVNIIASQKSWIESAAVAQLTKTAQLQGITKAVGLPDLHPGKRYPIGAAFVSKDWIYPALVGSDIGCGMGLWQTSLKKQKIQQEKWTQKLVDLDSRQEDTFDAGLDTIPLHHSVANTHAHPGLIDFTPFHPSLGTIGGGNHFAELQEVHLVHDAQTFASLGFEEASLYLLVHSGSRGLGEAVLKKHIETHNSQGLKADTKDANLYLQYHDYACNWAKANRALIAKRFLSCLHADKKAVLDIFHNTVESKKIDGKEYWIHRKGATPSDQGIVVIPGSRGDFSYLVKPIGNQTDNAFSLAHGAGRKWSRKQAKGRLRKFRINELLRTPFGSHVICEDKNLIYEEAPQAYKKIDRVIQDLVDGGLIHVIASLRPVITYKTRGVK